MNKELKYLILFSLLTLFGCVNEEDAVSGIVPPQAGETLQLTVSAADFVTDGAPDTRATDDGKKTTFDEGDRVGVIILDEGGNLLYNNIPYVYKSGSWTFDSNNDDGKGGCYYDTKAETYIVYYPYSRAADGVRSVEDLKTIFAPKFNQSNIKDYRASDLMVWYRTGHLASSETTLNAVLKHAFASVYLTPTAYRLDDGKETKCNTMVSDVSLTIGDNVYIPYQATDGSLRCIVPASINPSGIRCFYTFSGQTYGNTINISDPVANTRYTSAPEIIQDIYTLDKAKVGDFYCKRNDDGDGYLIPGDVALTGDQQKACIGIVYCTDPKRIGKAAEEALKNNGVISPRGLVMALTNASSDACRWGVTKDENDNGASGAPFRDNTDNRQKQYNNIDGYGETHWILDTYKDGDALLNTYTAFYHASRYGTVDSGTAKYAAPNTTTGWFIPSIGQWWDILSYLGEISLSGYQTEQSEYIAISGAARTAVNNMNKYLGKIEGATQFDLSTYFWSSSEYDSYSACNVLFLSSGDLNLKYRDKTNLYEKVRCVFAF